MDIQMNEQLQELAANPKVAAGVSAATASTGLATVMEWLPSVLGVIGSLLGITLSIVLIVVNIRKHRAEMEVIAERLKNVRAGDD